MKLRFGLGRKDGCGGERDGFVGFERDEEMKEGFWVGAAMESVKKKERKK